MSRTRMLRPLALAAVLALAALAWPGGAGAMPPRPVPYDENGRPVDAGESALAAKDELPPFPCDQFGGKNPPSIGTVNVPVLLVDFPGQPGQITPAQFNTILFTPSVGGNVSMRDYYTEVSRGQLTVTGQVFGWYTMPNAASFYVMGQGGRGDTYPMNFQGLVRDAVNAADAAVDFRPFDNDGPDGLPNSGDDDGHVDALYIVFSGYGSESYFPPNPRNRLASNVMWMDWGWRGPGPLMTADGVSVQLFATCSELRNTSGNTIRDIGVYCHEFGHLLGLPDYWSTVIPTMQPAMGSWNALGEYSLMAMGAWGAGGTNPDRPTHITGLSKAMLGWISPVHVTVDLLGASIQDIETSGTIYCNFPFLLGGPPDLNLHQRFFVPSWTDWPPPVDGFIVENRQRIGFDSQLAGSGLIIYHLDGRVAMQDHFNGNPPFPNWYQNAVEWSENHPLLDVECADQTGPDHTFNADDLDAQNNFGDAGDYFASSAAGFDTGTNPSSRDYNGVPTGFAVRNIGPSAATMTADLVVGSPPGPGHDIWVKDCPLDDGTEPSSPVCDCWGYRMQFASPDIWVDNDQDGRTDQPVQGATNLLFVKVRNRGSQGIDYATVEVYDHSACVAPPPAGPPVDPGNPFWGLAKVCSTTVQSLAAGDSAVFQVPWWVPPSPPPPNWNFPPSLGLVVRTATDTLNWSGDIASDNNLAMATGRKMWFKMNRPGKGGAASARERKLALLDPDVADIPAVAPGGSKEEPEAEPLVMAVPLNNPFEEVRDIMFDVEADLPPDCTAEYYLPELMPGAPLPLPFVVPLGPLEVTPFEIHVYPGPGTQHGDTGFLTFQEYDPATYPEDALGGMAVPLEVDLRPPLPVAAATAELFTRDSCVPYHSGVWLEFEPVEFDVSGLDENYLWYGALRDSVESIGTVPPESLFTRITHDVDGDTSWWEWADIDYPIGWPNRPLFYQLVAYDAAGNQSEPTGPIHLPATADYATLDLGAVRLTVTDQGICGYMEVPGRGCGLQYPKGAASILWTGGLWVGTAPDLVANRDYEHEPVKDWEKSEDPDGAVRHEWPPDWTPEVTDHEAVVCTKYRDTGGPSPLGLLVHQSAVCSMDPPDDDFVLLRYTIENTSAEPLTGLYVGQFMDLDPGDPAAGAPWNNHGDSDAALGLAWMWAEAEPIHAGVCLLQPEATANISFINNPLYVYDVGYILDADKYGFLAGSDPDHSVGTTFEPQDWGVVVSAGPYDLGPGQGVTVCFAVVAGDDLPDLQANAAAADVFYNGLLSGLEDGPVPDLPSALAVGPNVPNPFNPCTTVQYGLPRAGRVDVGVFDLLGRRVATLHEGVQEAGQHTAVWNAEQAASGIYLLRVQQGRDCAVRKMMLVK